MKRISKIIKCQQCGEELINTSKEGRLSYSHECPQGVETSSHFRSRLRRIGLSVSNQAAVASCSTDLR